jgi:hypothetical protein
VWRTPNSIRLLSTELDVLLYLLSCALVGLMLPTHMGIESSRADCPVAATASADQHAVLDVSAPSWSRPWGMDCAMLPVIPLAATRLRILAWEGS